MPSRRALDSVNASALGPKLTVKRVLVVEDDVLYVTQVKNESCDPDVIIIIIYSVAAKDIQVFTATPCHQQIVS